MFNGKYYEPNSYKPYSGNSVEYFIDSKIISVEGTYSNGFKNKYAGGYMIFTISILLYILISEFGPDPKISHFALVLQVVSQKIILLIFMVAIYIQTLGLQKIEK